MLKKDADGNEIQDSGAKYSCIDIEREDKQPYPFVEVDGYQPKTSFNNMTGDISMLIPLETDSDLYNFGMYLDKKASGVAEKCHKKSSKHKNEPFNFYPSVKKGSEEYSNDDRKWIMYAKINQYSVVHHIKRLPKSTPLNGEGVRVNKRGQPYRIDKMTIEDMIAERRPIELCDLTLKIQKINVGAKIQTNVQVSRLLVLKFGKKRDNEEDIADRMAEFDLGEESEDEDEEGPAASASESKAAPVKEAKEASSDDENDDGSDDGTEDGSDEESEDDEDLE